MKHQHQPPLVSRRDETIQDKTRKGRVESVDDKVRKHGTGRDETRTEGNEKERKRNKTRGRDDMRRKNIHLKIQGIKKFFLLHVGQIKQLFEEQLKIDSSFIILDRRKHTVIPVSSF